MARKKLPKAGVKVRYFEVVYNAAERAEHNAATTDIVSKGAFYRFFSCGPYGDDEEDKTFICFAISEDEANEYVERIGKAR